MPASVVAHLGPLSYQLETMLWRKHVDQKARLRPASPVSFSQPQHDGKVLLHVHLTSEQIAESTADFTPPMNSTGDDLQAVPEALASGTIHKLNFIRIERASYSRLIQTSSCSFHCHL